MMVKTSTNLYIYWNIGSIIMISMATQIAIGIILSTSYIYKSSDFFVNSCFILLNINYGWTMRFMHSNMTSMIFIIVLMHLARSVLYKNMMNKKMWMSGILMMLTLMAISFLGYSLVWSQMSYWASMVITNFIMVIPVIGKMIMFLMWGNRFIDNILINRFLSVHFALALFIMVLATAHILILHINKSTNPLTINNSTDQINLNPLFIFKDMIALTTFLGFFMIVNLNFPMVLNNPDNFNQMMMFKTPSHIEPEWYFLFFYSILRSINNKLSGLLLTIASITMWIILPSVSKSKFISNKFTSFKKLMLSILTIQMMVISFIGSKSAKEPYTKAMKTLSAMYFSFFIKITVINKVSNKM